MAFRYCFRIFVSFLFLRCLVVCQEQEVIASPSFPLLYVDSVDKVTESPDSVPETNPTQSPQVSLSQSSPSSEGAGSTNISTSIQPVTSHESSVSSSSAKDEAKLPEASVSAIPVDTSSPQVTQSSPAQPSSSSPVTSIDLTTTSKDPLQKIPITRTTTKPKIRLPPLTSTTPTPTFPPPLAKDPIGVRFFLYTRFHSNSPYVLDPNSAESLKGAYFTFSPANGKKAPAKNRRLYIVIHGLSDGVEITPWMKTVKTRILETDRDANVVLIDWSRGAAVNLLNDLRFASVRIVGQQAAHLIKGLQYLYPDTFSGDNVHIIAHSFGTFAADVVGRNIEGLGRITGLDPAGGVSNIALIPASQRLDPSDAKFVDVIHTDAPKPADAPGGLNASPLPQIILPGSSLLRAPAVAAAQASASGTLLQMGHYDFYPNGGYTQPGCNALSTSPAASILRPLLPAVTLGGTQSNTLKKMLSCSHSRAIDLFIESIKSRDAPGCSLVSYACSNYTNFLEARCSLCRDADSSDGSCALMGFHSEDSFDPATHNAHKKFYVTTNSRGPYCLYHYGVAVKIAKKPKNAARGGVLLVSLEGEYVSASQEPNLEVKLVGGLNGFKAGKTIRAIFTHFADVGAIKNAIVSWVPAPPNLGSLLSPSSSPSLYVQALKVYPMSFAEAPTRKAITRALCPDPTPSLTGFFSESYSSRTEPSVAALSAFFKEVTFSPSRCTHHNQHHHHTFRDVDGDADEGIWRDDDNDEDQSIDVTTSATVAEEQSS